MNRNGQLFAYRENYPSIIQELDKHLSGSVSSVDPAKLSLNAQFREIDELLYQMLLHQLLSIDFLAQAERMDSRHQRWSRETLRRLQQNGLLEAQGASYAVSERYAAQVGTAWQRWEQRKHAWTSNPDLSSKVILAETTLRALPEILTGQRPATDVMFPNASMELVEGVYRDTFPARFFNEVLADAVIRFIQQRMQQNASAQVRILEIGAGTGGTSAIVFHRLKPYHQQVAEYCYSDLSRAFLLHAESKFGPDNPFLNYQIFNVEHPVGGQNVVGGQYDLVIATNVLHATKDMRNTLRNAKALLQKNGLILMNEVSDEALWLHLTFGLLEGWWLSQDPELRFEGGPGLSPDKWRQALGMEGYRNVRFPLAALHDYGHQLIIAESDGIVRQPAGEKAADSTPKPVAPPKPQVAPLAPQPQLLDQVRGIIRQSVSEALKLDEGSIRNDRSFSDYGVDSIIGVRMMNAINKKCGIQMQTTSLFDYGSVDKLAQFIVREFAHQLAPTAAPQVQAQVQVQVPQAPPVPQAVVAPSVEGANESQLDSVKTIIRESVAESLKMDPSAVRNDRSFSDYGVDSIIGVRLMNAINKKCGIQMQTTSLFDYGSVDKLAQFILRDFGHALAPASAPQVQQVPQVAVPVAPSESLLDAVKAIIRDSVAESLKMDPNAIRNDRSFSDYGVDSIIGVRLMNMISKKCGLHLNTTSLFDYGSVDKLAQFIVGDYKHLLTALQPAAQTAPATPAAPAASVAPAAQAAPLAAPARTNRFFQASPAAVPQPPVSQAPTPAPSEPSADRAVAIVGMSGRFAQSEDVHQLWNHLTAGTDLVTPITRWNLKEHYKGTQLEEKENICNAGSFLDDIDKFDPLFFNISGLEATYMDPQQRIFMEESWKALEDAGYAGDSAQGLQCGVYVGTAGSDYKRLIDETSKLPAQVFWGNSSSILAARTSYYLDLQGPAVAIDTACSSSLVAIHLACQGLWSGETKMALAGGVFVQCTPEFYMNTERAGMLSPTGRCHAFDDRADGFVPGEGVGVLVLKRLADAIADGDHIHGVIRATAMNQDGQSNGITAPSAKSQERLERTLYDSFGINPESIQMVEAHGTGTKLGDPIEFNALTRAFRHYTDKQGFCAIGSVKTNIGHTATAAGVAGILKILLSMKHEQMPASLHYHNTNPNIQLQDSPFYVNDRLQPWTVQPGEQKRAVVSSFGFSGTNVHMLIEEAPKTARRHAYKPGHLIVLSALSQSQLRQQAERLALHVEREPGLDIGDIAYTLLNGRKHLNHRLACVVSSTDELRRVLREWLATGRAHQAYYAQVPENGIQEQAESRRYGNQCLADCQGNAAPAYRDRLAVVADLFAQGYALEYGKLFAGDAYSRVSLPAYPFARERYWLPETSAAPTATKATTKQEGLDDSFLDQLFDKVLDETVGIDAAVQEAKKTLYWGGN